MNLLRKQNISFRNNTKMGTEKYVQVKVTGEDDEFIGFIKLPMNKGYVKIINDWLKGQVEDSD